MVDSDLIEMEWKRSAWGNLETNLAFLQCVGLGAPPLSVLEIGCGKGALLAQLHSQGHVVEGIDVDPDAIAACRTENPGLHVQVASGEQIPFGDSVFDVVVSFDVFEHMQQTDIHLQEVRRVLRPGGRYLLQTPNKWTNIPFELLRHWRKYGTGPLASYRSLVEDHCALHSYFELKRRFHRNRFSIAVLDMPVVNEYYIGKVRAYLGGFGAALLKIINPDKLPMLLKSNFYAVATRD
jgi:SAM-dependent methyltransferase